LTANGTIAVLTNLTRVSFNATDKLWAVIVSFSSQREALLTTVLREVLITVIVSEIATDNMLVAIKLAPDLSFL